MAINLDGTGDYLDVGGIVSSLNGLSAVTASAWIKANATGVDKGWFSKVVADPSDNGLSCRYDFSGAKGHGTNIIKVGLSVASGEAQLESASLVQTTDWQHVLFTWESGQDIALYLDGVFNTPTYTSGVQTGVVTGLSQYYLGAGPKASWAGLMDDFRIYGRILTVAEIAALHAQHGADGIIYGLISRWKMDEASPSTVVSGADVVKDDVGSHHGTPNGDPAYAESGLQWRRAA